MNLRSFFILLIILTTCAHAQEAISDQLMNEGQITEEQIILNGYVDISGNVLLTGYATSGSLYYMPFLYGMNYSFDNNSDQLYAVTDKLTSKNADTWILNFSLEGYYSDYSVTFYLPPGSQITKFDIQPGLNYQVQVKEDSLILSVHGYRIISPWIGLDYKLPPGDVQGLQNSQITSAASILLFFILAAGIIFTFYRYKIKKGTAAPQNHGSIDTRTEKLPETERLPETKTMPVTETKDEVKNIHITGEMQKVIDTLSDKEKAIILLLIRNGGSATQADIRYEIEIPKSSLTGIINALKRKNIIKKREYGRTNIIELSEWFLSENKVQ
jgi:DNA-binding HxlR family transcriptional regulator